MLSPARPDCLHTWRPVPHLSVPALHLQVLIHVRLYDDQWRGWNIPLGTYMFRLNVTPAPLCLSDLVSVFVCALHVVSPRDLWWCVLPRWQFFVYVNMNVSSFFTARNAVVDSLRVGYRPRWTTTMLSLLRWRLSCAQMLKRGRRLVWPHARPSCVL